MWVVTAHNCLGSTAEAMDVYASFGGFVTEKEAKEFADILYENLDRYGGGRSRGEWFTQHFEVPEISKIKLPQITNPAELAQMDPEGKSKKKGTVAIDMKRLAEMVVEEKEFEELPPPAKDDEVAAAIASITGGIQ